MPLRLPTPPEWPTAGTCPRDFGNPSTTSTTWCCQPLTRFVRPSSSPRIVGCSRSQHGSASRSIAHDGIRSWEAIHRLVRWIVLFASIVAAIGTLQFFTGLNIAPAFRLPGLTAWSDFGAVDERSVVRRIFSTAIHPIEYGVVMAAVLPLAIHRAIFTRPSRWTFAQAALLGFATATSISRSAVIVAAIALTVLFFGWPSAWRRRFLLWLPVAVVAVRLAAPGVVGTIRALFTNLGNDPSVSGRTDDYQVVWLLFLDSPWLGRGLYTLIPRYYRILDNQVLVLLLELGVIGLGLFLLTVLVAIASARGGRLRASAPRSAARRTRHLGIVDGSGRQLRDLRCVQFPDGGRHDLSPHRPRRIHLVPCRVRRGGHGPTANRSRLPETGHPAGRTQPVGTTSTHVDSGRRQSTPRKSGFMSSGVTADT